MPDHPKFLASFSRNNPTSEADCVLAFIISFAKMNPWRHICVILCFQFHLGQALWQEFGRIQAFKEPLWSRNRVPRADRSIVQSVQERSNAKKATIQKQMDTMERLLST